MVRLAGRAAVRVAASAALTEALKVPGVDGTERATAIRRMTRAYLGAKAYERCIAYAEAALIQNQNGEG